MGKYFKHKIRSLLVVNKVVVIHYLKPTEHFYHNEEKHDFWEVVCAYKGNFSCLADGKNISAEKGDMIFHKPNELHSLTIPKGKDNGVFVISFECLSPAMQFFANKKVRLNDRQLKTIGQIIEIAKKTYDITFYDLDVDYMSLLDSPTLGGEQLIKNYFETLLVDIMRSLTETEYGNEVFLQESKINDKLAETVIEILKASIFSKITINEISKKISYSKAYVFKKFKKTTGKTVMDYYLGLKINKAKELLLSGEYSVKEISEKLCFDTPNYFTKTFKKLTGTTPTQYKKTHL